MDSPNRVLAVFAHPDDIEFMAAAAPAGPQLPGLMLRAAELNETVHHLQPQPAQTPHRLHKHADAHAD